jgi:type IV secretion system protein VirB3
MTIQVEPSTVFMSLTRPQTFAGVTYTFFVANLILNAELFLIFKSAWIIGLAAMIHTIGAAFCLRDIRFFDLWLVKVSRCPRVKNYGLWNCNSYQP